MLVKKTVSNDNREGVFFLEGPMLLQYTYKYIVEELNGEKEGGWKILNLRKKK